MDIYSIIFVIILLILLAAFFKLVAPIIIPLLIVYIVYKVIYTVFFARKDKEDPSSGSYTQPYTSTRRPRQDAIDVEYTERDAGDDRDS